MRLNHRFSSFVLLSSCLVFALIVMKAVSCYEIKGCEKIKCKYQQRAADLDFSTNSEHATDNRTRPQSTSLRSKYKSEQKSNFCVSYISSTSIDKSDLEKMFDCAVIDLSGNNIYEIESDLFENHEQLESLNLSRNQLTLLPENVFDDLVNLRKLSLKNNFLEALDADLFAFNVNLEHLDVSQNKLTKISPSVFDGLPNLKSASFKGNLCIDAAFPQKSIEEMREEIITRCGERNLLTFIVSLMKISSHLRNGSFNFNGSSSIVVGNETANSTFPTDETSDLDTLIISLFWLIIPIIAILFGILAIISFAVYNKYFVYSLRVPNHS